MVPLLHSGKLAFVYWVDQGSSGEKGPSSQQTEVRQIIAIDRDTLKEKLAAPAIRAALQRAGMFLTGWELLKTDINDSVRRFFELGSGGVDPRYKSHVLARHKNRFEASLLWLVDQGALTVTHSERVRAMRVHRNEIAHELPKLLIDPAHEINSELLKEMATILRAVGVFWGRIALETNPNPEFDGTEVKDEEIHSGAILLMAHLVAACKSVAV